MFDCCLTTGQTLAFLSLQRPAAGRVPAAATGAAHGPAAGPQQGPGPGQGV